MSSQSVVRVTSRPKVKVKRYSTQPRVPAGSPRGGQFASSGSHAGWVGHTEKQVDVVYQLRNGRVPINFGQRLFGRPLDKHDYVALTGALPGSKIELEMEGSHMHLRIEHPQYRAHRIVFRDQNGILTMKNEWFGLTDHAQRGRGLGARIFARQVDGAAKLGIQRIKTQAARNDDTIFADHRDSWNGYYTWARLGYNTTLKSRDKRKLLHSSNPGLAALGARNAVTLHELFDTPGGPEHWHEHGSTIDMSFDPTPNSPHRQRLDEYLYKKGINPYAE